MGCVCLKYATPKDIGAFWGGNPYTRTSAYYRPGKVFLDTWDGCDVVEYGKRVMSRVRLTLHTGILCFGTNINPKKESEEQGQGPSERWRRVTGEERSAKEDNFKTEG
uniref:Uncharacterized protein n=1 Tax=Eutreptiella gymnastica TaxID=73025 RepID=A0A7S1N2V1_9EUGL|mmetsp:Transcript_110956/g.192359  ORF Transcript_110956/g.192359 Transcript_110956/m.192359 type:complete len:108 (+) Transcript_110956:466-789(+)